MKNAHAHAHAQVYCIFIERLRINEDQLCLKTIAIAAFSHLHVTHQFKGTYAYKINCMHNKTHASISMSIHLCY